MSHHFVVLGASGGIGAELCRQLVEQGDSVTLAGRSEQKVASLADQLNQKHQIVDATDLQQLTNCLDEAVRTNGPINGIVNCVGSLLLKPAHLTSQEEWMATISSNLTTAFNTVHAGVKAMLGSCGSIVLVSSAAARIGLVNHEAIAAAKAGVIGLTLSAAATYANKGIRVNCVAPGLVETPLTARLTSNEASLKASTSMHALGRIGQPQDVAAAIAWFLDSRQSWVTGQILGVDGGLANVRSRG
jgi:NAD(P)-dependent dehydrogenase (short-subunit alcohol dehydrogenase family)